MKLKAKRSSYSLDLTVYFSDSLLLSSELDTLRSILQEEVPEWSSGLHFWLDFAGKIEFSGDFTKQVRDFSMRKGSFYPKADQVRHEAVGQRRFGITELHGSERSLLVVISCDDLLFAPTSGIYRCANSVSFQFREPVCCGRPVDILAPKIMSRLAESSNLLFGNARLTKEWDAKNMCFDNGAMAIGGDISRYLPGLYWLNYFGSKHTELIGKGRLLSSPAFVSTGVSDGVVVQVDERPESWNATTSRHACVMRHIGERYFFLRDDPTRITVAPDFGLPTLKRFARFT